jgi:hypothetical protein
LASVDTRNGQAVCFSNSPADLDSIDFHKPSSTLAAFGCGVSIFDVGGDMKSIARYAPTFDRAERNAGAFNSAGQLFVTAPDSSLVLLEKQK